MVDSGNGGPREWRTPGMADLNRVNCVLFGLYISERQLEPDPTSEQASFLGFCASSLDDFQSIGEQQVKSFLPVVGFLIGAIELNQAIV